MKKIYLCKDCGEQKKSNKGLYCRPCSLKHKTRRKGLKYNIKVINKGWVKKGQRLSPETEFGGLKENRYIKTTPNVGYINHYGYKVECKDGQENLEHRVIMEQHLGRKLNSNECVHHIDLNVTNNNIDNLLLCSRSEHMKIHHKLRKDK